MLVEVATALRVRQLSCHLSIFILIVAFSATNLIAEIAIYPNPGSLTNISHLRSSTDFQVTVDGLPCFVYESENYWITNSARRSQDKVAFTSFGLTNTVAAVEITFSTNITNAVVRPGGAGITPVINGNKLSFSIAQPTKLSVEVNSNNLPLLLIAETPEVPDTNATYYYGPGVYQIGTKKIVKKGESVYIAGGAVVEGTFSCTGTNASFRGRGILTCGSITDGEWLADNSLCPINYWSWIPKYQTFDGLFIVNSPGWTIYGELANSTVRNVKMISWIGRSDGIHLGGNSLAEDCLYFINDDCLIGNAGSSNIWRNCVVWKGYWGHAIIALTKVGENPTLNCLWENNDIIGDDGSGAEPLTKFARPLNADPALGGTRQNMVIRNLRIEGRRAGPLVKIKASDLDVIDGVHFENISTTTTLLSEGELRAEGTGTVGGVDFLNLHYAGKLVTNFVGTKISIVGTNVATPQIVNIPTPLLSMSLSGSTNALLYLSKGQPSYPYQIQTSTTLSNWTTWQTLVPNTNGTGQLTYSNISGDSERFYRAIP
jgi:hypothetical protein